jgi:hypothetical protein
MLLPQTPTDWVSLRILIVEETAHVLTNEHPPCHLAA